MQKLILVTYIYGVKVKSVYLIKKGEMMGLKFGNYAFETPIEKDLFIEVKDKFVDKEEEVDKFIKKGHHLTKPKK